MSKNSTLELNQIGKVFGSVAKEVDIAEGTLGGRTAVKHTLLRLRLANRSTRRDIGVTVVGQVAKRLGVQRELHQRLQVRHMRQKIGDEMRLNHQFVLCSAHIISVVSFARRFTVFILIEAPLSRVHHAN
jgi:hypothetical protein